MNKAGYRVKMVTVTGSETTEPVVEFGRNWFPYAQDNFHEGTRVRLDEVTTGRPAERVNE